MPPSAPGRLGIFGGTFDPVHYGHLLLAETCREQLDLDQVWLMPAATSPYKAEQAATAARHRLDMLQLAVGGHHRLLVSTMEIDRGGISYTVDTLEAIRQQFPQTELFLLMGADSLEDLPHWRAPERICELSVPVGVRRSGLPEPSLQPLQPLVDAERLAQCERCQASMPLMELSSSDLRRRVASGLSIRYRTPRAVEKYIETHKLYARPDTAQAAGSKRACH